MNITLSTVLRIANLSITGDSLQYSFYSHSWLCTEGHSVKLLWLFIFV